MTFAGIDLDSRHIHIVKVHLDTLAAAYHAIQLPTFKSPVPSDAPARRCRAVGALLPVGSWWDDVAAIGIEKPMGKFAARDIAPLFGAVLATLPQHLDVLQYQPNEWKTLVGLKGGAKKPAIREWAMREIRVAAGRWPQDACDAYGIARAAIIDCERAAA